MRYQYKPLKYFTLVMVTTWILWWVAAAICRTAWGEQISMLLMLLGLLAPSVIAFWMIMASGSPELKRDYKEKFIGFYRVKPLNILFSILLMGAIIAASISLSLLFGQSPEQFSFVGGFSFSIGSIPSLLTLVVAAALEELGWRGYAEDCIANSMNWFRTSVIFGIVWSLWHFPLFFIEGTYQHGIAQMNIWFAVNFLIAVIPMAFILTWVYVKNNRSIFACIIFHFFSNLLQEEIAMTQATKCIETFVLAAAAILIVAANREMFFETRHVGKILDNN